MGVLKKIDWWSFHFVIYIVIDGRDQGSLRWPRARWTLKSHLPTKQDRDTALLHTEIERGRIWRHFPPPPPAYWLTFIDWKDSRTVFFWVCVWSVGAPVAEWVGRARSNGPRRIESTSAAPDQKRERDDLSSTQNKREEIQIGISP